MQYIYISGDPITRHFKKLEHSIAFIGFVWGIENGIQVED